MGFDSKTGTLSLRIILWHIHEKVLRHSNENLCWTHKGKGCERDSPTFHCVWDGRVWEWRQVAATSMLQDFRVQKICDLTVCQELICWSVSEKMDSNVNQMNNTLRLAARPKINSNNVHWRSLQPDHNVVQ